MSKVQAMLFPYLSPGTVFENHRKSLIQHCERRDLRLHFEFYQTGQFL